MMARNDSLVVLDHVQYPSNIGSCIRISALTGIERIIIVGAINGNDKKRSNYYSMSHYEDIDVVFVENAQMALQYLSGYNIIYVDTDGTNNIINSCKILSGEKIAFVFGSEKNGITSTFHQDESKISIHVPSLIKKQSYNVSTIVSVVLYEKMKIILS